MRFLWCVRVCCFPTMAELLYSKTSEQWLELLGHYTTVTLKNQKSITGYLYTIDPTSQHVVMYDSKDQRVVVVMSSSIRDLNGKACVSFAVAFFVYLCNLYSS